MSGHYASEAEQPFDTDFVLRLFNGSTWRHPIDRPVHGNEIAICGIRGGGTRVPEVGEQEPTLCHDLFTLANRI
jgi:hypothetical protein